MTQHLLYRGIGHPWTAEPGWDKLILLADSEPEMIELVDRAQEKFWRLWYRTVPHGTERHSATMYKPSGAESAWQDVRWQGTPRGHGHQFRVGDEVYTDFASTKSRARVTRHRVTAIEFRKISQTGVMLRVSPKVPGSIYIDDRGEPVGDPWIDSAWFRRIEE